MKRYLHLVFAMALVAVVGVSARADAFVNPAALTGSGLEGSVLWPNMLSVVKDYILLIGFGSIGVVAVAKLFSLVRGFIGRRKTVG